YQNTHPYASRHGEDGGRKYSHIFPRHITGLQVFYAGIDGPASQEHQQREKQILFLYFLAVFFLYRGEKHCRKGQNDPHNFYYSRRLPEEKDSEKHGNGQRHFGGNRDHREPVSLGSEGRQVKDADKEQSQNEGAGEPGLLRNSCKICGRAIEEKTYRARNEIIV